MTSWTLDNSADSQALAQNLEINGQKTDMSAVSMTNTDWSGAFNHQDPTKAVQTFFQLGVGPSLPD